MKVFILFLVSLVALAGSLGAFAQGKQFEIFDGQFYNNQYYPVVDIIEWGEQRGEIPHMEFHLHSKDKRIELAAVPGDKNGKPVLWLMYDLSFRGERICRMVLAPLHFRKGMKVYAYRDEKDPDYDNVYVTSEPKKGLPEYPMPPYERCTDELAVNMPEEFNLPTNSVAGGPVPATVSTPPSAPAAKKPGPNIGVDYDNQAVPFSF